MLGPYPRQLLLAIATFLVIITVPQFVPAFHNWRVFEWSTAATLADFTPRERVAHPVEDEKARLRPESRTNTSLPSILDPANHLDNFYAALARTERQEPAAVTRILHYGDSPTTADLITADARRFLQQRFGDAGLGAYLISKPWAWYGHAGVESASQGWKNDPATLRDMKDGFYGLAGVSSLGKPGAWTRFTLRNPGHNVLRLSYLGQPEAGTVAVLAEDEVIETLDTSLPQVLAAHHDIKLPAAARKFELRVARAPVRLFGVSFEKQQPGVLYHSLGMNGAWAGVMAHYVNEAHWADQLKSAKPHLVVINYGTNESVYPKYVDTTYSKDVVEILRRVHAAVPDASVLVMSPMDRGIRESGGHIGTVPVMPRLVALQARLATENGCAFFNTFEAMGGPGTMGKWYQAEPRLVSADFIHPLPAGARIVGDLLYRALLDGYNRYKLRQLRNNLAQLPR